jgi:hypothetical protein
MLLEAGPHLHVFLAFIIFLDDKLVIGLRVDHTRTLQLFSECRQVLTASRWYNYVDTWTDGIRMAVLFALHRFPISEYTYSEHDITLRATSNYTNDTQFGKKMEL